MLQEMNLINFKGFKGLNELDFKPITILCGANSCGKSSILQSILLLKQTAESKNPNQTILFNGRFVHLGTFKNIVFGKKLDNKITVELSTSIVPSISLSRKREDMRYRSILRQFFGTKKYSSPNSEYTLNYRVTFKSHLKDSANSYAIPLIIDGLHLSMSVADIDSGKVYEGPMIELSLTTNDLYDVKWKNLPNFYGADRANVKDGNDSNIVVRFSNLFPTELSTNSRDKKHFRDPNITNLLFAVNRINTLFQMMISSFTYLGPLREEPSRRYIYENEVVETGIKGENAAYIYLAERESELIDHYTYSKRTDSFTKYRTKVTLKKAITNWLSLMNIKNFEPEPLNEIIQLNMSASSSNKTKVNIADVGFGVSQIFPILLEGLRMPIGNTLLLEQPEIHLHPNLQMQLADYFITLGLSRKNVIVETHSDHIINRLVRRIVEDNKYELNKLIAIYFIKTTSKGSIVEPITIDDKSGIVNWPEEFFDQTANEQQKTIVAGIKKRMKLNKGN